MRTPPSETLDMLSSPALYDLAPETGDFLQEALEGLRNPRKTLPPKYFYDARGSELFDRITEQPEYYPTRTELSILTEKAGEMAALIGPRALLVEYGSGSSIKTRLLLDHLVAPAGYVPIDISGEHLLNAASELAADYEDLPVFPVCADYLTEFELPDFGVDPARIVVYFPGSTIGNFTKAEARAFLARIARQVGPGGALLIGVDLKKDVAVLERAYNDRASVTAAFNKNVLARINRELGADFDLDRFDHLAYYNPIEGRIEMHLVAHGDQTVHLGGEALRFRDGETIHTENSYKFSIEDFAARAASAGLRQEQVWTDPDRWFSVQYLVPS